MSTKKVRSSFHLVAILFAWANSYILRSHFPSELVLKISWNVMASKRMSEAPRQDQDAKKPWILQKFLLDYTTDWLVLKPSMKVATFCYCCTCRLDFSIGHGRHDDCKRHVACKHHKEYAELRRTCPSVCSMFKQKETRPSVSSVFKQKETLLVLKTTRAEALLVTTLVDSNLPLTAADKNSRKPSRKCFQTEITWCDAFLTEALNFLRNCVLGP